MEWVFFVHDDTGALRERRHKLAKSVRFVSTAILNYSANLQAAFAFDGRRSRELKTVSRDCVNHSAEVFPPRVGENVKRFIHVASPLLF